MVELRIFFDPKEYQYDLFETLGKLNHQVKLSTAEVRSDSYINLNEPSLGLKLRAGTALELKWRCELKKHQAEKWKKVLSTGVKSSDSNELQKALRGHTECVRAAGLLQHWNQGDFYEVDKNRQSCILNGGRLGLESNCHCEQVHFDLKHKGQTLGHFVSINFEGAKPRVLSAAMKLLLKPLIDQGIKIHVMGYPEFIMKCANGEISGIKSQL